MRVACLHDQLRKSIQVSNKDTRSDGGIAVTLIKHEGTRTRVHRSFRVPWPLTMYERSFSFGLSIDSMTNTSRGPLVPSSRSPSCSLSAVKNYCSVGGTLV